MCYFLGRIFIFGSFPWEGLKRVQNGLNFKSFKNFGVHVWSPIRVYSLEFCAFGMSEHFSTC